MTLLEICAQNQGNSISGDLKCKISWVGACPQTPPRRDRLQRSIITIRLLRHFCQLLEKLWTTLKLFHGFQFQIAVGILLYTPYSKMAEIHFSFV